MAKKDYGQRLRERWKRREAKGKSERADMSRLYDMIYLASREATGWIMPFLFGKRNR